MHHVGEGGVGWRVSLTDPGLPVRTRVPVSGTRPWVSALGEQNSHWQSEEDGQESQSQCLRWPGRNVGTVGVLLLLR